MTSNKFDKIRVRFAPSPTGPLHIGGVRTALYNYLFAKKHGGDFLLRIEDTDQTRYVEGAEDYIVEALNWFGLTTDESPLQGGDYGPYRQSDRKHLYTDYAKQLVEAGHAYYAFDTPEDLEAMREREKQKGNHTPKYDYKMREQMKNSLTLNAEETAALIEKGENVTIRLCIQPDQDVAIQDLVRGEVVFNTSELDDKVILKNDGMPTYHLANIVDDHLMQISHVIRGEEWLSSTAHHVLMYQFFGWEAPQFAHLPLILKPTGKGKLSKRDGAKFGFPVFPLQWDGGEDIYSGFREFGFLPEAVLNFLVLLGWNPGNDVEMMSVDEMIELFDIKRIVKSGARFDFDKAKWFNQQYVIQSKTEDLLPLVKDILKEKEVEVPCDEYLVDVIELMKERVELLPDFYDNAKFFFTDEFEYDKKMFKKKYKAENAPHFEQIKALITEQDDWSGDALAATIKGYIGDNGLSFGAILPILRILVCGTMKGPDIFPTMGTIGKEYVLNRWTKGMETLAVAES